MFAVGVRRLLERAVAACCSKNAYAAVNAGRSLQTLQPDQIAALRAGGKSLDELTGAHWGGVLPAQ